LTSQFSGPGRAMGLVCVSMYLNNKQVSDLYIWHINPI